MVRWDEGETLLNYVNNTLQVTRAVKTKLVALTVLHRKGKFVDHLFEGGLIEQKDYDALSV